jgi:hypothetical protein
VYLWAGYVLPGKHTILIYDRENRQVYKKDVLIEQGPLDPETGMPSDKCFPFIPCPLSEEETDKLDNHYAQVVQNEELQEEIAAMQKAKSDLIEKDHKAAMAKFNKSKKKGKKKK